MRCIECLDVDGAMWRLSPEVSHIRRRGSYDIIVVVFTAA